VAALREAGRGHATSRRDASVDDCRREWAERWYATTAGLRPTTRRDYRKLLDLEILPTFAAAPLASIDALAVREWLATLAAGGLGPKRAGKARAVLSQALASAVEGGKLSRNVAAGVKPPKVQRAEMCFVDADQVEALAEAIDPRWATLIRFGAYSGLRPSELTALKVGRLDLLRATVRVVEAATEVDGHLHWGGVKTHEARTVRLPRSVADDLGGHLAGHPHGPGVWCSRRHWAGRCAGRSGPDGTSSRPRTRPACRSGYACTTCSTNWRVWPFLRMCAITGLL
jgi:integrase